MPRFFITTDDNDLRVVDQEGQEFPDEGAARLAALQALPDMAKEKIPDGDHRILAATVSDSSGTAIYRATLTLSAEWLR